MLSCAKYLSVPLVLMLTAGCCSKSSNTQNKSTFNNGSIPVTDKTSVNTANAVAFSTGVATMFFPPFAAWPFALSVVSTSAAVVGGLETQEEIDYLDAQFTHNFEGEMNNLNLALIKHSSYRERFLATQKTDWEKSAIKNWHDTLVSVRVTSKHNWRVAANGIDSNNSDKLGLYGQFVNILGGEKLDEMAKDKDKMQKLARFAADNGTLFRQAADELSMSFVTNATNNSYKVTPDINSSFQKLSYCKDEAANKTLRLFDCEYDVLEMVLNDTDEAHKLKIIDEYNLQIFAARQLNFIALEYLYYIEAVSNYLNYLNFKAYKEQKAELVQIPSYENINGVSFVVSDNNNSELNSNMSLDKASEAIKRYGVNLNSLYGARTNALYLGEVAYLRR